MESLLKVIDNLLRGQRLVPGFEWRRWSWLKERQIFKSEGSIHVAICDTTVCSGRRGEMECIHARLKFLTKRKQALFSSVELFLGGRVAQFAKDGLAGNMRWAQSVGQLRGCVKSGSY